MTQKKARKKEEEILQQKIMSYFSSICVKYDFIYFCPMNEIVMSILTRFRVPQDKIAMIMNFLKKMGWLPGVSDIVIGCKGKMFCMELKTQIGKQSKAQILFETNCKRAGIPYMLVRSFEQCRSVLFMWNIID